MMKRLNYKEWHFLHHSQPCHCIYYIFDWDTFFAMPTRLHGWMSCKGNLFLRWICALSSDTWMHTGICRKLVDPCVERDRPRDLQVGCGIYHVKPSAGGLKPRERRLLPRRVPRVAVSISSIGIPHTENSKWKRLGACCSRVHAVTPRSESSDCGELRL
jgi:hypothetical protein